MHILCPYTDQKITQQGQKNSTSVFTALTTFRISGQIILVATLFREIPSLLSHCVSILIYIFHVSMYLNQLYPPHFICIIGRVFESSVAVAAIPRGSRYVTGHCSVLHSFHWGVAFGKLCFWKLHKRIFKEQFVGSKSFHGQGAIVVTGHYLRFGFSLKSWIDDFTISKCGHSWGFLLSFTIEAQKSEVLHKGNRKLCKKHFSCFRVCVGSAAWPPTVKGSVSGVGFAWQVSPKGDSWLSFTTFLTNSATPFIWTPSVVGLKNEKRTMYFLFFS